LAQLQHVLVRTAPSGPDRLTGRAAKRPYKTYPLEVNAKLMAASNRYLNRSSSIDLAAILEV